MGDQAVAAGFTRLVHADWSVRKEGRWRAAALWRDDGTWRVTGPSPVGLLPDFVDEITAGRPGVAALAGFDFPIGLPEGYCDRAGLSGFREALPEFGQGTWASFFEVAADPAEVGLRRPFYPRSGGKLPKAPWLAALDIGSEGEFLRACERGASGRRAASCMFWTLGASQVGKAALHGWRDVVRPCLERGAHLWPFDGPLPELAKGGGLTLCETYPADAYTRVLGPGRPSGSKRRQDVRMACSGALREAAERLRVVFDQSSDVAVREGFGPAHGRDDGFDALVGLLGMIEVVTGRHADGAPDGETVRRWEGWILGR